MHRLLRWFFGDDDLRAIESELDELHEVRCLRDGARAAARWRRRQLLQFPVRALAERMRPAVTGDGIDVSIESSASGGAFLGNLWRDARHSLRSLAKTPALTATIVLTVGLALGATTAMIGVIRAVLVEPLPYASADDLVTIVNQHGTNRWQFSVVDFQALERENTAFSGVAAYSTSRLTLASGGASELVRVRAVTSGYFSLLGLSPFRGRLFDRSDSLTGPPTVVLAHAFWADRFGSDPSVVGRTIMLDGRPSTVVGVLPPGAGPLEHGVQVFASARWPTPTRKGPFFLTALGRLHPGVSRAAAADELHAIAERLFRVWQSSFQDSGATWAMQDLKARVVGTVGGTLWLVLGGVACVLLIAWTNAANLLVARAMHQRRELAIRSALGASRRRLLQRLLAEGAVLAIAAAILGGAIAIWTLRLVRTLGPAFIPRIDEIRLTGPVLGWLAVLAGISALLFGLIPAVSGMRTRAGDALRAAGRTATDARASRRLRRILVAIEFAVATPLVIAATLVSISLARLQRVEVGLAAPHVLTASIALPAGQFAQDTVAQAAWDRVRARLEQLPGVAGAAFADSRPPADLTDINNFDLEDHPARPGEEQPTAPWVAVSPGYFRAAGLPIVAGRPLDERDALGDAPPVVVVDRAWAQRFFPGQRVLGRRFREGGCTQCPWSTVVGVADTVKYLGLDAPDQGTVYSPIGAADRRRYALIRVPESAMPSAATLREAVREVDPNLAVSDVATVEELARSSLSAPADLRVIVAMFAITALVLAIVGVYGVMAYFVQQHARDIAIRLAIGGDPGRVSRMVIRQGVLVVLGGVAIGIGAALLVSRLMTSSLYGVAATDPSTFIGVSALMLSAAIAACAIPARRAAAVDPAVVLRDS